MADDIAATLIRHREKLLSYVRKRVSPPDLAEDLLQDSLLKALKSAGELRAEDKLLPWFYRILQRAIVDHYRKRQTESSHVDRPEDMDEFASPDPEDEAALCECFRELLPTLKPEYARLIERLELGRQDTDQVAADLGIHPNNLKVRRHRARQALRQRLEETCRVCAEHGCLDCTCRSR